MAYRELELTLLSAQELKSVNLITRMDVYAVVSISNDPLTRQCTEPDTYGGRNPCWNATFRFAVPPTSAAAAASSASLHVLLRAERFLGDRDVGEVVIPLSDVLAGATGVGPQPPQAASYQVRKLHRREPRGVLNVQYRLGPIVAPVVDRAAASDKAAGNFNAYVPVGMPPQPGHHHPSAGAYYPALPLARSPPIGHAVAVHDEAAQKNPPVMAYQAVGVPLQQQASHAPAKPDAYRPPPPSPSPPPPRPAAVHTARHEEAHRAPTPPAPAPTPPAAPAPAPAPPAANGGRRNDGHGQAGPTHFYMGPNSQIIFSSGGHTTVSSGPPPRTTSPARSIISPGGKKGDGNWALQLTQGGYASAADSMSVSVPSPRSRNEDRWRPNGLSQSQLDTQQQQQQAASSPVAAAASPHRLAAAASPFSSRSSSFSSPLSPYSSASAHPSPSPSSAHSSTHSPYHYSAHPSAAASPHQPLRSPAASDGAHGTNNTFRSTTPSRGAAISSPLPSSSPMIPNHSHGSAVSSPLPWSSHMVPKNSSVVPTL